MNKMPVNPKVGKPCKRHPELLGMRYTSNRNCIQCGRDDAAKSYAKRAMTYGEEITILRGELHKLHMENDRLLKMRNLDNEISKLVEYDLINERDQLKAENEALRKDAERFRYIQQDADSGMRRIYGDDWIATIDAQGFQS